MVDLQTREPRSEAFSIERNALETMAEVTRKSSKSTVVFHEKCRAAYCKLERC
jgi:hypothetical protein